MMRPLEPSDLVTINYWYNQRSQGEITPDLVPGIALIEPGIAVGLLYRTDAPGVALIDGLVTNPEAPIRWRVRALREITEGLIELARLYGHTRVMGFSKSARRAERLGFRVLGTYALAALEVA